MDLYKKYAGLLQRPQGQGRGHPAAGRRLRQGQDRRLHRPGLGGRRRAIEANPAIEKDIGYFTIPGETADKPEGVFLGGSNLAVAEGSKKQELAKEFLKIALSDKFEGALAKEGGVIPNKAVAQTPTSRATRPPRPPPAAANGRWHHPADPGVGRGGERRRTRSRPIMTAVLKGKSHAEAAK